MTDPAADAPVTLPALPPRPLLARLWRGDPRPYSPANAAALAATRPGYAGR